MTRKECYQKIKELHLEEHILNTCGDNYTRVKTERLIGIVEEAQVTRKGHCDCQKAKQQNSGKEEPYWNFGKKKVDTTTKQLHSISFLLGSLCAILVANGVVDKKEIDQLLKEADATFK